MVYEECAKKIYNNSDEAMTKQVLNDLNCLVTEYDSKNDKTMLQKLFDNVDNPNELFDNLSDKHFHNALNHVNLTRVEFTQTRLTRCLNKELAGLPTNMYRSLRRYYSGKVSISDLNMYIDRQLTPEIVNNFIEMCNDDLFYDNNDSTLFIQNMIGKWVEEARNSYIKGSLYFGDLILLACFSKKLNAETLVKVPVDIQINNGDDKINAKFNMLQLRFFVLHNSVKAGTPMTFIAKSITEIVKRYVSTDDKIPLEDGSFKNISDVFDISTVLTM